MNKLFLRAGACIYLSLSVAMAQPCAPSLGNPTPLGGSLNTRITGLSMGDVTGDGRPDVVLADQATASYLLYMQQKVKGLVSFHPPYPLASTSMSGGGIPVDVFATAGATANSFSELATASITTSVAGREDIALGRTSVGFNTLTEPPIPVLLPGTAWGYNQGTPRSLATGDLDGNKIRDYVVVSSGGFYYFLNLDAFWFRKTGRVSFDVNQSSAPTNAIVEDLTGDGYGDVAIGLADRLLVFPQNPGGVMPFYSSIKVSYPAPGGGSPTALVAVDFDRDGRLDLVTGNLSGTISLIRNTGKGGFMAVGNISSRLPLSVSDLATGDFNSDGITDLVASDASGQTGLSDPNDMVLGPGRLPIGTTPIRPNPISPNPSGSNLVVLSGTGSARDGYFTNPVFSFVSGNPEKLEVGDLNGDRRDDIVVAQGNGGTTRKNDERPPAHYLLNTSSCVSTIPTSTPTPTATPTPAPKLQVNLSIKKTGPVTVTARLVAYNQSVANVSVAMSYIDPLTKTTVQYGAFKLSQPPGVTDLRDYQQPIDLPQSLLGTGSVGITGCFTYTDLSTGLTGQSCLQTSVNL